MENMNSIDFQKLNQSIDDFNKVSHHCLNFLEDLSNWHCV